MARPGASGSRDRPAVDDVLCAADRFGPRRDDEGDEIGNLTWPRWASQRNPAKRLHDDLLAALIVGAGLGGEPLGERDGRFSLDPTRRDPYDADSLWRYFLRQSLAVGRERGFRRRVCNRGLRERQLALNRCDMNNHAR